MKEKSVAINENKIMNKKKTCTILLVAATLIFLPGCQMYRHAKESIEQPVLESGEVAEKAGIYHEIALRQKDQSEAFIQIVGSDVELPPTSASDQPADVRKYYFDVWINSGVISSNPMDALRSGELIIDVVNAKATIEPVGYDVFASENNSGNPEKKQKPLISRAVVRIAVESRDLTQSFTIIAKVTQQAEIFEAKRRIELKQEVDSFRDATSCIQPCAIDDPDKLNYEKTGERIERRLFEENPYMAVRTVKVFNGDLHTQVFMLSDIETRDAFGANFARAFYVGKAYFRNRHADRKLIVNTTSLRAKTIFYREPEDNWLSGRKEINSDIRFGYLGRMEIPAVSSFPLTRTQAEKIRAMVTGRASKIVEESHLIDIENAQNIAKLVFPGGESYSKEEYKLRNESAVQMAMELIQVVRQADKECLNSSQERQNILKNIESGAYIFSDSNIQSAVKNTIENGTRDCLRRALDDRITLIVDTHGESSPIALDLRRRVGLTNKIAAASQDIFWQADLSRHGYLWEDYYRPMTFESVLLSLSARTRAHPVNKMMDVLQSMGSLAGALVGMDQISSVFGTEGFAQRVAVTTGVFLPEMRKLLMKDIDLYLSNLASTALPSILTLAPNESRDGYVFFPRGPIFGYGVDEFSISSPSFIVNIDNDDVSVDGALIEGEVQFSAGQQSIDSRITTARNQGHKQATEELAKLADLQAKLYAYQMRFTVTEVCQMLDKNQFEEAKAYLLVNGKLVADNPLLKDLQTRADEKMKCSTSSSATISP